MCGAVRYTCMAEPTFAAHCHCDNCRLWSGTGHSSNLAVRKSATTVTGTPATYVRPTDTGHTVTRSFCATCGVHLFAVYSIAPDEILLNAASLDDLTRFKPDRVLYASRRAAWDYTDPSLATFERDPPPHQA